MKNLGSRIIIGDFFETDARQVMCDAYSEGMTQLNGYVWFLPGWYRKDWYDLDAKRRANEDAEEKDKEKPFPNIPNCTTAEMVKVSLYDLSIYLSFL